jgi:hypothetical protein
VAQEVNAIELKRIADPLHLLHVPLQPVKVRIAGPVGPSRAELIEEHHRAVCSQTLKGPQRVVGEARAAMQAEEWNALTAGRDKPVPDPAAGDIDEPLGRLRHTSV